MPNDTQQLAFGPFLFHLQTGEVWLGEQRIPLTPKASAILHLLVTHSGQVVSKDDLWRAVWPDTVVSEAALSVCIHELRTALDDDARQPRYIETVHRRGYRFIAAVVSSQHSVVSSPSSHPIPGTPPPAPCIDRRHR